MELERSETQEAERVVDRLMSSKRGIEELKLKAESKECCCLYTCSYTNNREETQSARGSGAREYVVQG